MYVDPITDICPNFTSLRLNKTHRNEPIKPSRIPHEKCSKLMITTL